MRKICVFLVAMVMASGAAYANIASSEYVERRLETTVSVTDDQDINGTKDFKTSPVVPTPPLPSDTQEAS